MRPLPLRLASMLIATVILIAACTDDGGVEPPPPLEVTEIEARVHVLINQHRTDKGLPTLELADAVTREARSHSADMASGLVSFGHSGFEQRVQSISETIPLSAAAEHVANNYGFQDPAAQAINGWLNTEDHLITIEGDFDLTGIGVARNVSGTVYLTQIFIKSR